MFTKILVNSPSRRHLAFGLCLLALGLLLVLLPHTAMATPVSGGGGSKLPYEDGLKALTDSLTGPVALAISLIGIVAAGAVLIFGGEMSGFLRTMVFLVLVIAVIVNAAGLIGVITGNGTVIASAVPVHADAFLSQPRGFG